VQPSAGKKFAEISKLNRDLTRIALIAEIWQKQHTARGIRVVIFDQLQKELSQRNSSIAYNDFKSIELEIKLINRTNSRSNTSAERNQYRNLLLLFVTKTGTIPENQRKIGCVLETEITQNYRNDIFVTMTTFGSSEKIPKRKSERDIKWIGIHLVILNLKTGGIFSWISYGIRQWILSTRWPALYSSSKILELRSGLMQRDHAKHGSRFWKLHWGPFEAQACVEYCTRRDVQHHFISLQFKRTVSRQTPCTTPGALLLLCLSILWFAHFGFLRSHTLTTASLHPTSGTSSTGWARVACIGKDSHA
jgi:hypothetical protein